MFSRQLLKLFLHNSVVIGLVFGAEFWHELEDNFWNGDGLDQWFIISEGI